MEIFDVHQHMHIIDVDSFEAEKEYEWHVRMMDENGIAKAAIMPFPGYFMPNGIEDTKRINDLVAEYSSRHHDRYPVAIGTVEPRHGKKSLDEIDRIVKELHMSGLVLHHRWQGAFIDGEMTKLYLQKVSTLNIPVFIHIFGESLAITAPWRLENLLSEFPEITFVALDGFSAMDRSQQMVGIARRHNNVVFDTALMIPFTRVGEEFVKNVGSERLLFGTDLAMETFFYKHVAWLHDIKEYQISEKDKENILGGNAKKLFRL